MDNLPLFTWYSRQRPAEILWRQEGNTRSEGSIGVYPGAINISERTIRVRACKPHDNVAQSQVGHPWPSLAPRMCARCRLLTPIWIVTHGNWSRPCFAAARSPCCVAARGFVKRASDCFIRALSPSDANHHSDFPLRERTLAYKMQILGDIQLLNGNDVETRCHLLVFLLS